MSANKARGLGKGLDSLIPNVTQVTNSDGVDGVVVYAEIPITNIKPNPKQPRLVFDEDALNELAFSIKEIGLLQPVVVRPLGDGFYELVAGERRWRASKQAGITEIPAIIRQTPDDTLLRDSLLENLHRVQLNALEEAAAYQQLLNDFGCTQDELSQRIGRSRPQISNTIRLLRLPVNVQRRVAAGVLSAGHARALLALPTETEMEALATRIVAEGLSVRQTEEIVAVGDSRKTKSSKKSTGKKPTAPGLLEVAERLSDKLDTRVTISMAKSKGVIAIDFATVGDLQRIVDVIEGKS